jgi:hypothetical protein
MSERLVLEYVDIARLKEWPENPRQISKTQFEKLKQSLSPSPVGFGIREPFVVNLEDWVIGGHQRLKACLEIGYKEVPITRVDLKAGTPRFIALNLALNKISGEWDLEKLRPLLIELRPMADIGLTGFESMEIEHIILSGEPMGDSEDEGGIPPLPKVAEAQIGELWQLGEHSILCDDSTKKENVDRLLANRPPVLMATDPPYGVSLDHTWREDAGLNRSGTSRTDTIIGDESFEWLPALGLSNASVAYVWHSGRYAPKTYEALESYGYEIRQQIIWFKTHFALSRQLYHWKHEPCWFAVKKGASVPWYGDRTQTTVWEAKSSIQAFGKHDDEETLHPAQKPLKLFELPIHNHLKHG